MTDSELPAPPHMTPDEFRRLGRGWWTGWRTTWSGSRSARPLPLAARRHPRHAPGRASRARRALGRHPGRPRPGRPAGHHPLAVAELLRLLPGHELRGVRARRARRRGAWRPGDAVVHEPGVHGARDAHARLDGRHARTCRPPSAPTAPAAGSSRTRPRAPPCAPWCGAARQAAAAGSTAPLVAYTSDQGHSSIEKAARIAGWRAAAPDRRRRGTGHAAAGPARRPSRGPGRRAPALVRAPPRWARPPPQRSTRWRRSARSGAARAVAARGRGLRGGGRRLPRASLRQRRAGARRGDSTNPHKWLLTNFDCDLFWVRDRAALIQALSVLPEYLRNAATESRRRHRLPGLAGAAGPPFPRAEAVVRPPPLRRGRAARPHPRSSRPGTAVRACVGRRPLRAGRSGAALARLLPAPGGRGRGQPAPARRGERRAAARSSPTPAWATASPSAWPSATRPRRRGTWMRRPISCSPWRAMLQRNLCRDNFA